MNETTATSQPEFNIIRLYIKDISFESPLSPKVFEQHLQPMINLNIQTTSSTLAENTYEVVLSATVTVSAEQKTIFLIEVKQAGIFTIKNIPTTDINAVLNITCPNILFPYVRETVSELAVKGGFQHFYLAPINFEALYLNSLNEKAKENPVT